MTSLLLILTCVLFVSQNVQCIVTDIEYGRLPPIYEYENYDRCMMLGNETLYCSFEFLVKPIDSTNVSFTWQKIQELNTFRRNYRHDNLRRGVCLTLSCPDAIKRTENKTLILHETQLELAKYYNTKLEKDGIYGEIQFIHCQDSKETPYSTADLSVIYVLVAYIGFVIIATFYEGLARYKSEAEYKQITGTPFGKFVSCFSITKNFYRLKTVDKNDPDTKSLKCIQGARFFNMFLVVLAHFNMASLGGPLSNTKFLETVTDDYGNFVFVAGSHAVQTFFLISAWLLTFNILKAFEDKKKLGVKAILWIFLNRYIRLTPPLAVALSLHATLLGHSNKGPNWANAVFDDVQNCKSNAWTNLLYINNYVNPENMCMQQSWYLASDTQLFLMGLIILAAMIRFRNYQKSILGVCFVIGLAIPGILAFVNNYEGVIYVTPEPLIKLFLKVEEWHVLYSAGYSNISSYIVGMYFGLLFYNNRNNEYKPSKFVTIVFYIILPYVFGIGIILIAIPFYDNNYVYSNIESALNWAVSKAIFTAAVGIALYGATRKIGWLQFRIITWNPLQVLGRLTYSVYLIHVFLLRVRIGSIRYPLFYSRYIAFVGSMGDASVAYFFAFIFCLLFEMPITALQKMWLPQKKKEEKIPPQILVPTNIENVKL